MTRSSVRAPLLDADGNMLSNPTITTLVYIASQLTGGCLRIQCVEDDADD